MKKMPAFVLFLLLLWAVPQGCSSESDETNVSLDTEEPEDSAGEKHSFFNLWIVDAPGDYSSVWVEVLGVEIVVDKDTIPLNLVWADADQTDPGILDLLEYTGGGFDVLIKDHTVPLGSLKAIILILGERNSVVTSDGNTHFLTLTEDIKKGIAVPFDYTISEGEVANLTIDFDVDASLSNMEDNSLGYILDPQIRAFDNNSTGQIYGYLGSTVEENMALVTLTSGDEIYTTQTYYNDFMLWGLPPGTHDITLTFSEASGIDDLVMENIEVVAGERTDIGPIDH